VKRIPETEGIENGGLDMLVVAVAEHGVENP